MDTVLNTDELIDVYRENTVPENEQCDDVNIIKESDFAINIK